MLNSSADERRQLASLLTFFLAINIVKILFKNIAE